MKGIKDTIRVQAAKLRTNVEMSGFSALAFAEHSKKCQELVDDFEAFFKYLDENKELSDAASDKDLLTRLEYTLQQDLIKVDTKYLISNEKSLTSPAGFYTSDRVFLTSPVAIQVDDLSEFKVPAGQQLFAHDIDKIVAND